MRKIVELLTGKKEEEIRKGYEDIINSKDDKIKNLEAEITRIKRSANNALIGQNDIIKSKDDEIKKLKAKNKSKDDKNKNLKAKIKSNEDIIKSKDDKIKNLEAEIKSKDEQNAKLVDNYIKNTREEDKRIREEKADILNNKQKQARLFNAKYDAMDEDGLKIKSHITTNKELKNEKEKYDQYKTDRKLKALKTNGEDDNSATFEEIFEYNLINVRYDLKENDLSYLEVKPVNANPITDGYKYKHMIYLKTNEYNKVIIIPISNLGEAQIPQIGYIDDTQLIKHNVANAFSYFIKYYSIKYNDFETNMNLGSKIYNLSAKM